MLLDPRYVQFFDLWNQGEFYDCHEVMEDLWLEASGPERPFYQGLALAAGAFAHLDRKNLAGCAKLLADAIEVLEDYPPRYAGFEVREFVDTLATWQARVTLMSALGEIEFPPELLPQIETPQSASVRRPA